MTIAETVSASKKLGESDARALVRGARTVYVAKGKKLDEFAGGKATKDIVTALLGSTGNLRAPTMRVGKDVVVGFNEDLFTKMFG